MTDEPYRWVEAIANRREYIEDQLAGGSPIAAVNYDDGILFLTVGRERHKVFEIYDRIAMGGIGHPGDIERLRMAAIEVAGTEGFTRSAHDVSLRRLATYSMSPALKAAFEQVYGAPYLARMLFAELGRGDAPNLYVRLDYDGAIHTNGGAFGRAFEEFGVIAGSKAATGAMERSLREGLKPGSDLAAAARVALNAWVVGKMTDADSDEAPLPDAAAIAARRAELLEGSALEAAVLSRSARSAITYRTLPPEETWELIGA